MTAPDGISLKPIALDDIEAVRVLHKTAWRALAGDSHSDAQMLAHEALIDAPGYASALMENNLTLAWRDERPVGSAGWCDVTSDPSAARIRKVFVSPDMAGTGLGRVLVEASEAMARALGRTRFTVRSNANAEGFYAALGYRPVERGLMPAPGADLPVVFMEKSA